MKKKKRVSGIRCDDYHKKENKKEKIDIVYIHKVISFYDDSRREKD